MAYSGKRNIMPIVAVSAFLLGGGAIMIRTFGIARWHFEFGTAPTVAREFPAIRGTNG
jgi:hypothetical protein